MTEAGRVALMAAVRRIATTEGGDRFESLSQRDIRLQLPAALSAVRVVALHASVRLWFPLPLSRAHHVQVRARSYTATGWSPFARPWPHPPSCSTFCLCSEHTHFIPYKMKFRQKEHCSLRPCVGKELTWKPHKVDIPPIRSLTQG